LWTPFCVSLFKAAAPTEALWGWARRTQMWSSSSPRDMYSASPPNNSKQAFLYLKQAYFLDWLIIGLFGILLPLFLKSTFRPVRRQVASNDPQFSHPFLQDIVSTEWCTIGSFCIPSLFAVFIEWRQWRRTKRLVTAIFNLHMFLLGLLESTLFTVTLTEILKLVAGRPRPYYLSICEPLDVGDDVGIHSSSLCRGEDIDPHLASQLDEARKSFPSGHTSLAFASAMFFTFKLMTTFKDSFHRTWQLILLLCPLLLAFLVGISRTLDYHHHFGDVVGGALLGTLVAWLAFMARFGGNHPMTNRIGDEDMNVGSRVARRGMLDGQEDNDSLQEDSPV